MQFYSQDGQDEFIANLFKNKKEGFFLDIGAFDGITFSNTFYLEKNLSWKGICIEPNPLIFQKLEINRNSVNLNYCVSDSKGIYKFLSISGYGIMLSGLVNFFDHYHLERIDKIIQEHGGTKSFVDISAMPLRDILKEYPLIAIDYCNIDVEGGEINVLKSIDFSKIKIKVFTIENNYGSTAVRKFLKPLGYKLIAKLGADEVYQLNSKRYDLMIKLKVEKLKSHIRRMLRLIRRH